MLAVAMLAAWVLGGVIGLPRADRISLLFAGSHKSIATGAPLAAILFAGPQAGIVILPALIYHQLQLIVSAPLAARLAKS
jgi:sodium/bile acid cotransporter 7